MTPIAIEGSPGPVDVVVALPDGSAYAAFNPIDPDFFLFAEQSLIDARASTHLRLLGADGNVGDAVSLPRGDILGMTLDGDGESVWIGSTAGLYVLRNGNLEKITAAGRLGNVPVRVVTTAPDGAVWMGVDRQGEDSPAAIMGYTPAQNDVTILNSDMGLPEVDRIDMVDLLPDGRLASIVSGSHYRSRDPVFVRPPAPPEPVWSRVAVPSAVLAVFVLGSVIFVRRNIRQREEARFAGLMDSAQQFFARIDRPARRLDYRTLELTDSETGTPDAESNTITVHCLPGDEVDTSQVEFVANQMPEPQSKSHVLSYLFAERDLEPAARWKLDTIRLREHKVIIPLTLPYVRRALDLGNRDARNSLDSLDRRYLAEQDLFDMRNAIDEPRFFFGRKTFIEEIAQALGRREHIAIIGQRKVGKTSVLNVLGQQLNEFPMVVIDLQIYSRGENWAHMLLRQILDRYDAWGTARFGDKWQPAVSLKDDVTGTDFEQAIRERHDLRHGLGSETPLVVILDEIERLFPRPRITGDAQEESERRLEATQYIEGMGILRALGQRQGERLICLIVADRSRSFNLIASTISTSKALTRIRCSHCLLRSLSSR